MRLNLTALLVAVALAGCKKPAPSAVKESDPAFPASCAEAKENGKKAVAWLDYLQTTCTTKPGSTGCPAAADLATATEKADKVVLDWRDYEARVCAASASAAGSAEVDTKYEDYDFYYNNCHDAANCGIDAGPTQRTGVVRCSGAVGPYYGGHTLNYVTGPCLRPSETCQMVCLFEPQAGVDSDQCCWEQPVGAIDLKTGKGKMCADAKCMNEQNGQQDVLPPGQLLPKDRPTDCRAQITKAPAAFTAADREACDKCCAQVASRWAPYLDDYGPSKQKEWEANQARYLGECQAACAK